MTTGSLEDKLGDALERSGITLVITSSEDYAENNSEILRFLVDRGLKGIYVTVNKPYGVMRKMLEGVDIDVSNLFFIDAVSKDSGAELDEDSDQVMYLQSPKHLTDISIVMGEAVEQFGSGDKFIFFDSLSVLTIYNNQNTVAKFAHYLTGKMRSWDVVGVIISVKEDTDDQLLARLTQFCDNKIVL